MHAPPEPAAAQTDTDRIPPRTTPTWETELLISGVTVFALLQLPAMLNAWADRMLASQNEGIMILSMLSATYAKAGAITLAVTFVLHLALRAYWIALVGMHSVYPGGIRWDALKSFSPHAMRLSRQSLGSMAELVERADNRASLVFANGVGLAVAMIVPMVFAVLIAGVALLVVALAGWRDMWGPVFAATALAAFLPFAAASLVDRYFGDRMTPGSRAARLLERVFNAYQWFGVGRASNPILVMSSSQVGYRRAQIVASVAIMAIMGAVLADSMLRMRVMRLDRAEFLPAAESGSARLLDPQHYATSRDEHITTTGVPFIPAEVVRGEHLRLFIPYRPRRHGVAISERCPHVAAAPLEEPAAEAQRIEALVTCLAGIHSVTLDGAKLPPLDLVFATDAKSGARGMVAMIPVGSLAPGRHTLTVERAPRTIPSDKPETAYVIPFWR